MRVMHIEIPIPNYYGEEVFHQTLLFEEFPSREKIVEVLEKLHQRDQQYPEYTGNWAECIQSVEHAEEWPDLWSKNSCLMAQNTFTQVKLRDSSVRASVKFQWRGIHE